MKIPFFNPKPKAYRCASDDERCVFEVVLANADIAECIDFIYDNAVGFWCFKLPRPVSYNDQKTIFKFANKDAAMLFKMRFY